MKAILILSQNGQSLANLDNLTIIYVEDGGFIIGKSSGDGVSVFLGKYDEQSASRILKEIIQLYDEGKKVYIMPEE